MRWSTRKIEGKCRVCGDSLKAKGLCAKHYRMQRVYGRTHRILQIYEGQICDFDGCDKPARVCGYCRPHYKVARRLGTLHPGRYKRDHAFYGIWWNRKKEGVLRPEWSEDFWQFVKDVGARPSENHFLVRLREGLLGPTNFEWKEKLRRREGETIKQWHARKWQARKAANPNWDMNRKRVKQYGLTLAEYQDRLTKQNHVCAICKGPETKIDYRTQQTRMIAVDHDHTTGKVRGLLCSRCNMMIGQIDESVELLQAMQAYMLKHLEQEKT